MHLASLLASYFLLFLLLFLHHVIVAPRESYCFTFFTHYSSAPIFLHSRSSRHNPLTFPLYFPPKYQFQPCFFQFFNFAIFIDLKCGFLLLLFLNEVIITVFQPILYNSIPPVGGNATGPMDHWRELWTLERNHCRSKIWTGSMLVS